MPNMRRKGTKIYSFPVDEELQAKIEQVIKSESERLGRAYKPTRADVIRKVLEDNCHRYITGSEDANNSTKGGTTV